MPHLNRVPTCPLVVVLTACGFAFAQSPPAAPPAGPTTTREDWQVLFNGRDLEGWTPKISKHELGDNFGDTFRVEDGLLKVRYDKYRGFDGQFGHLFYKSPFSHYRLVVEYRFVGTQAPGSPGTWAFRNSGAMLHSQDPRTLLTDQDFPLSIEAQFLGGRGDGQPRPTANLCTPGTEVVFNGIIHPEHCLNSRSRTFDGDQWVRAEIVVHGSGNITHYVNGEKVLEYSQPQFGGGQVEHHDTTVKLDGQLIDQGYIALQSESHPLDIRKVELLNLAGCMDKAATNYKRYYVMHVASGCQFPEGAKPTMRRAGEYALMPDSLPREGIPKGRLEGPFEFRSSLIAGTVRRYWIYVPAQYDETRSVAANLLVFQDGQRATNPNGSLRVPQVMENLIGRKLMPLTIGVFVTPGHRGATYPQDLGTGNPDNRSAEYDSLDDLYVRMLIEELLPEVGRKYRLTDDPEKRVIGGTSSGAIAAFTAAWQRPDYFRRVISMIGSYTSIGYRPARQGRGLVPGGDLYPTLIRKSPIKPLRVFLQDGEQDLSNEHGNWFLANQQMLSAFEYANAHADREGRAGARYEVRHQWGDGAHSDQHGGALLPQILQWIWPRD